MSSQNCVITTGYYFFFYLGFTARQDYFTHFEPSHLLGGAKTGDPCNDRTTHKQDLARLKYDPS